MNDDRELIQAALQGQSSAFGRLVQKYQDRLFNAMVHMLGDAEDARDTVQDAFVQAFVKLETFQQTAAFYTWLYRIAFNSAISRRRRSRPVESLDRNRETSGDEPADAAAGDPLESQERAAQVRQALSQVSPEHRQILVLRDIDDLSCEEIGEVLQLPVGTVRSRLHRARLQLKELLQSAHARRTRLKSARRPSSLGDFHQHPNTSCSITA